MILLIILTFFLGNRWILYGFLSLVDSLALPWCMGFYSRSGLGVSYEVDRFWGKLLFWCGSIF